MELMDVISLPDYLKIDPSGPVQLFDYRSLQSTARCKVNLNRNTFSFLLEGTKEVIADNISVTIKGNKFLLLKSGHCLMTETISSKNNDYKSMLLFFTDEMVLDVLERNRVKLPESNEGTSFVVCEYDGYIRRFVQSLEDITQLEKKLQSRLLKVKLEEIMIYLIEKEGEAFLRSILKNNDSQTIKLSNVVESNKLNKLTLQELAFLCNMSLSTFKREFSKRYQATPSKWFQEKRLEHAAYLLSNLKKRPIELYEEAGYDSLSNFVHAFKKKYGITPKQFQLQD